jgi:hypothetical protein
MNNIGDGYLKNYVQGYEMSLFFQIYIFLAIHLIMVYIYIYIYKDRIKNTIPVLGGYIG